jgi:putative heme-binding domain-containing protein
LNERREVILPDLAAWTRAHTTDESLLEALWMHQSVNVVNAPLLEKLLTAKDGRIRAAATRVLSYWHDRVNEPHRLLAKLVIDDHPRVRLEAVRALAKIPTARSAELVLSALNRPMDNFLDYAIWLSINDLATPWIEAIQSGAWAIEGREKELEFGLRAVEPRLASSVLSSLWQNNKIPRDGSGPWIELIGRAGSSAELKQLFDLATTGKLDPSANARTLTALAEAARLRNLRPASDLKAVAPFLKSTDEKVQLPAVQLAGLWKQSETAPALFELAENANTSATLRAAAFQSLRGLGGKDIQQKLRELTADAKPLPVRQQAAQTLVFLDPNSSGSASAAVQVLSATTAEDQALALWRSLLSTKGAPASLAKALPKTGLPPVVARTGLRVAREGGRKEPELVLALARHVESDDESKNLSPVELQELAATAQKDGKADRGEKLYRRPELGCISCHAIGGVGGKVGPDLTSIGASAQMDYLVESVLFPNRKIKEGYHAILVETKDGEEVSGVLVRETPEALVLRDVTNREISVPKANVNKKSLAGSLMPSGLIDTLSAQEQYDLYEFLSQLGKPGPYDASRSTVARSWKLFAASIDIAQFGDERVLQQNFTEKEWVPSASLVDGRLPKTELQARLGASSRNSSELYALAQFSAPKDGPITFELENLEANPVWVDGKPISPKPSVQLQLPAGTHNILVKLDGKKLPEFIRVKSSDGTFLPLQ